MSSKRTASEPASDPPARARACQCAGVHYSQPSSHPASTHQPARQAAASQRVSDPACIGAASDCPRAKAANRAGWARDRLPLADSPAAAHQLTFRYRRHSLPLSTLAWQLNTDDDGSGPIFVQSDPALTTVTSTLCWREGGVSLHASSMHGLHGFNRTRSGLAGLQSCSLQYRRP